MRRRASQNFRHFSADIGHLNKAQQAFGQCVDICGRKHHTDHRAELFKERLVRDGINRTAERHGNARFKRSPVLQGDLNNRFVVVLLTLVDIESNLRHRFSNARIFALFAREGGKTGRAENQIGGHAVRDRELRGIIG